MGVNPYLEAAAAREGKRVDQQSDNPYLRAAAARERPKVTTARPPAMAGKLNDEIPPANPLAGFGVQDQVTKQPVDPRAIMEANKRASTEAINLAGSVFGVKAAGTPKNKVPSPSEALGLPDPSYKAPQVKPPAKLTKQQIIQRDPANKPAQMAKSLDKQVKDAPKIQQKPKIVRVASPVGPIEIESSSIGMIARIPSVGEVQAPNQAALQVKIKAAIQAKLQENETFRLSPNVDPYEPQPMTPAQYGGGQRYMNDRDKHAAIMQDIEKFAGGLGKGLTMLLPSYWATEGAKALGADVPEWVQVIAKAPASITGQIVGGALSSPAWLGAKMNVIESAEFSNQEKAETIAGMLAMALTSSATPLGPSLLDDVFKLFGKGAGAFDEALGALEAKAGTTARRQVEQFVNENPQLTFKGFTPEGKPKFSVKSDIQEIPNASKIESPTPVYGDVRTRQGQTGDEVPIQKGSQEVRKDQGKGTAQPRQENVTVEPPKEGQALANRVNDILKKRIGEPEYAGTPKETVKQWAEGAVKKGYHEPERAQQIAREVIDGTRKALDKEETVGMAAALDDLSQQWDDVSRQLEAKAERGGDIELSSRLDDIRQKIVDISEAGNRSGAEWGRSGVARQAVIKSDGSFAGIIARRQKIVKRDLTANEIAAAKKEANELKKIRDAQDVRIRELEDQLAQKALSGHTGGAKPTREKVARVEAKIQDVSERLKKKWAENKPTTTVRSSVLFGADIAAEQVARVAKIAPEILELAKLHAEKGLIKLADNTGAVVKHLKSLGINDIEENDIAAVLAGRIRGEGVDRAETTYEALRKEASSTFTQAAKERTEQRKFIAKREAEIRKQAQGAQRARDEALLREEKAKLIQEERAARQAEADFWKEVRAAQRTEDAAKRKAASLDRKESIRRWMASVQGKRAAALERLDKIQQKLDFFHENQALLGAKSALPEKPDDTLLNLRVKEASLKRQMSQIEHQMRQAEIAKNKTPIEKLIEVPTYQIPGTLRNLLAMGDMSWSGIQGALVLFLNPKAWGKGLAASGKALFSKNKTFIETMEKLRTNGTIDKIIASGVDLPGLQPGHADEFFADTFADALPVYGNVRKGSQQAYDAASTVTRVSLVESWIRTLESSGRPLDEDALKVLGEAANTLTGKASGKGGQVVGSWPAAGKTLFAPSWWLSQFQGMTGKPLRDALIHGYKTKDWRLAKLMAKEYGKITASAYGTLVVTAEILKRAKDAGITDWEIETNIQSSDYGKIWTERGGKKISVDFLPPQLSAPLKFSAQAVLGTRDDKGKVKTGSYNRQQLLGRTFEGKYGPGFRIGFGMLDSINATENPNKKTGKPKYPFGVNTDPRTAEGLGNIALTTLPPIAWQQAYKGLAESNLSPTEKAVLFFLAGVGRGPNVYEKPKN